MYPHKLFLSQGQLGLFVKNTIRVPAQLKIKLFRILITFKTVCKYMHGHMHILNTSCS